ncbi:MAG TPA: hypothetical protein VFA99_02715 [Acidobacteriaceae bacterium]|nr:hypothetical protein [Acidobacteriaceae bacterium]
MDSFTLDLPTEILSITAEIGNIEEGFGNNWQVEIGGPVSFALPPGEATWHGTDDELILPAGSYGVAFIGGNCPIPGAPECLVAGVNVYIPIGTKTDLTYTEIGGTMSGHFGFTLQGESITPEPSSWILLGTALLLSIPLLATKYARASRLPIF